MLSTVGLLLGNASYATTGFPGPLPGAGNITNPDIVANDLTISYIYGGGGSNHNTLDITGSGGLGNFLGVVNCPTPGCTIDNLTYDLHANLAESNNALIPTDSKLTITGAIPSLDINSAITLLTANLTAFGTNYSGSQQLQGTFQFLGNVDPLLTASQLHFGSTVVVNASSTNLSDFNPNFNFSGDIESADNSTPVPEPGTLILLAAGGLALCGVRRRYPAAN